LRPLKRQAEAADLHARLERQSLEARWELTRDDARIANETLSHAQAAVDEARAGRTEIERELEVVAGRREAAEEALTARGAKREELSRRCFVAQAAAERTSDRADAARAAAAAVESRLARARAFLAALPPDAGRSADPAAPAGTAEAELLLAEREAEVERASQERTAAERAVEQARAELRDAERAVESARREAARIGGELASVNQFLRASAPLPGGAAAMADELTVDPGYELAVAAVLDGRLRAAIAADRDQASALLDRTGVDGGRVLVGGAESQDASGPPPAPDAERLADRVPGDSSAAKLARALLMDAWVVDRIDALPDSFEGVAVTRSGRVWAPRTRELRQAAAEGDERVLAERNRREQLVRDSEAAVQAEYAARQALERSSGAVSERESDYDRAIAGHRAAVYKRDEAAEEVRRLGVMLERAEREREERARRINELAASVQRDETALPAINRLIDALTAAAEAISARRERFERELAADRQAGEQVAVELRECAQAEAALQGRLHAANELLTEREVAAQRARDRGADAESELRGLAARLELDAEAASDALGEEERQALTDRIERLARRREQLGPVNPLAGQEYEQAVEHVEELERQREDLETALNELEKLIRDTDREIRESFEQTFNAAAANFEELAERLFPGGRGRLRLVSERDAPARVLGGEAPEGEEPMPEDEEEEELGVEIEITPGGKAMKRLSLLSGGEKAMTALAFLFAVFLAKPCPFYVLDEVEAALDDLNIDRFLELLRGYSARAQFIVVTHQKRTMEAADSLYGVSMGGDGISKVISRRLPAEQAAA
jgi:chromosome segregation protein